MLNMFGGMNAYRRLYMTKMIQDISLETYTSVQQNSHEEHLFVVSSCLDSQDRSFQRKKSCYFLSFAVLSSRISMFPFCFTFRKLGILEEAVKERKKEEQKFKA